MKAAKSKTIRDAEKIRLLEDKVVSLEQQLDWFKRQVFGRKSEKRLIEDYPEQPLLDGLELSKPDKQSDAAERQSISYSRNKQRGADCATASGLRFAESVPKKTIRCKAPELEGPNAHEYQVIREEHTYRLAHRSASYVVLEYIRPVLKHAPTQTLSQPPAPPSLWEGTLADVSFVAGLMVEKFIYHQPLYRQHQRLSREGIELSRTTLSNLVHRGITLLEPIYQAQLQHVLQSKMLAIDETPIKAGWEKPGNLRLCWYWPIYGQDDQVVFTFSRSRGHKHLLTTLGEYTGTILSDGHSAYRTYANKCSGVIHAQCWVHTRREFVKAEKAEPEAVADAFDYIGQLYQIESHIKNKKLDPEQALQMRAEHAKPVVDAFFTWCQQQCQRIDLVPSNPLSKALKYARQREDALRLYLADPELPMDTNHLERTLRVIPMGRRSWLFNWTEIGGERVGIIQSLLTTCRLHDVHPYTYLVDVLQRVAQHPASRVEELTPRRWKLLFADNPLRSDLDLADSF